MARTPLTPVIQIIVTFIEINHPELLPYLAPADSPILHTIKLIKEYYPQYLLILHKIMITSFHYQSVSDVFGLYRRQGQNI
jgi:Iron only hydrogenase large subunit, C-terminal domain